MTLNIGILNICTNLGVSCPNLFLVIVVLASLIFYARDFRVGVLMTFFTTTLLFMFLYALNLNYTPTLIVVFISLIMMSLSFYGVGRDNVAGGLV